MARHAGTQTHWTGHDLYDKNGEKIGMIDDIRFGDVGGGLKWLVVKTGLLGTKKAYVPAGEVESRDDRLRVPFSKDQVKDSPRVKSGQVPVPDAEKDLCTYYGLDYLRSATDPREGCIHPDQPS